MAGAGTQGAEAGAGGSGSGGAAAAAAAAAAQLPPFAALVELEGGGAALVARPTPGAHVTCVHADGCTGALRRVQGPLAGGGHEGEREAVAAAVAVTGCAAATRAAARGVALLGYACVGGSAYVLLCTKAREAARLPWGEAVLVPTETVWRKVPLRWPDAPTSKAEGKALAAMLEYQVADVHFFAAEGTDLTRPMALKGAADASETEAAGMEARAFPGADCEFVWNAQLAEPVTACGAAGMCPALVQGFAESRSFGERTGQRRWHLLLLARRSWLHPGPRFIARGLNARCMPGNEVECEHVLWVASKRDDSGRRAARWASHIWRRGSVPIWWEQRIEKAVGEAEIYVRDNPTRGAGAYFEHIFKRYETLAGAPVESTGAATRTAVTGYTCINLLRCAEGRAEVQLTEYFQQAVREARKAMNAHRSTSVGELGVVAVGGSGDSDGEADNSSVAGASQRAIEVVNFDWHATVKQMGEDGAVEGMWERLQPHVASSGFSMGEVRMPATPGGAPEVTLDRKQCGFLRFNCADSLDRTNLGGFYAGLQTLVAMCKALDLDIAPAKANASNGLPAGWEMRMHEGKPFYIDHNTKTTTWTHPFADEQGAPPGADDGDGAGVDLADGRENLWAVYEDVLLEARKEVSAGTRRFKESVSPQLLSALAEIHVNQGDVHAAVYTGTKAQHSRSMHVLSAERPRGGQRANKAANAAISIQRRIVNMAQDSGRLLQQEAFLGASKEGGRSAAHLLPALRPPYACAARGMSASAVPLRAPAAVFPGGSPPESLLLGAAATGLYGGVWVCPPTDDSPIAELAIGLSRPTAVRALVLTLARGGSDATTPAVVDIAAGDSLDALTEIASGVCLPRAANGTTVWLSLEACARSQRPAAGLCDFGNDFGIVGGGAGAGGRWLDGAFVGRVVQLRFRGPARSVPSLTLGPVEVVGDALRAAPTEGGAEAGVAAAASALATASLGAGGEEAETEYAEAIRHEVARAASAARPISLRARLELEALRLRLCVPSLRRDALAAEAGVALDDLDPNRALSVERAARLVADAHRGSAPAMEMPSTSVAAGAIGESPSSKALKGGSSTRGLERISGAGADAGPVPARRVDFPLSTDANALTSLHRALAGSRRASRAGVARRLSALYLDEVSEKCSAAATHSGAKTGEPHELAAAPGAFLALRVPTAAEGSAPAASVLCSADVAAGGKCWVAPAGTREVAFHVVLSTRGRASAAAIEGSWGQGEAPHVTVHAESAVGVKAAMLGEWDAGALSVVPLAHPAACRMLRVTLSLPMGAPEGARLCALQLRIMGDPLPCAPPPLPASLMPSPVERAMLQAALEGGSQAALARVPPQWEQQHMSGLELGVQEGVAVSAVRIDAQLSLWPSRTQLEPLGEAARGGVGPADATPLPPPPPAVPEQAVVRLTARVVVPGAGGEGASEAVAPRAVVVAALVLPPAQAQASLFDASSKPGVIFELPRPLVGAQSLMFEVLPPPGRVVAPADPADADDDAQHGNAGALLVGKVKLYAAPR